MGSLVNMSNPNTTTVPIGWKILAAFVVSGFLWLLIGWAVSSLVRSATVYEVLINAKAYAPPPCNASVCELYGPGGIVQVWEAHVDKHMAKGRRFIVTGPCASACMIAAIRANAPLVGPEARLIPHKTSAVWK